MEREIRFKCPVAARCGGCQMEKMTYREQLDAKKAWVDELLRPYCRVEPIIGMEDPFHYRNKTHAVLAGDRRGNIISGVYRMGTHDVVPVEHCLIENEKADEIIGTVRKLMKSFKIRPYREDARQGLMRHVLVRTGHVTGQIMVVLVAVKPVLPGKNEFIKALLAAHPEITTVVLNVNDRATSMVLGKREIVLYGKGYIEDELCGKIFRISPQSFYQVNSVQTEKLYRKAIEYAQLTGKETLLDAYCGIGTIGLSCADQCAKLIGVELNPAAVKDAGVNARRNRIEHARFTCDDAGRFMLRMAAEGRKLDVLMMDPPRAGSDENFLRAVCTLMPARVVYISCNPVTLVRDLKVLTTHGYRAVKATPVDMFPCTEHVETVVLLSHKKPDGHINGKVEFGEDEGKVLLDDIAERTENYKPKERVTYKMIKEYIEAKYGFKVHTAYIAEVKRELGLPMYDAPNAVEELKNPRKHPTPEKVEAIKDALKHFEVI